MLNPGISRAYTKALVMDYIHEDYRITSSEKTPTGMWFFKEKHHISINSKESEQMSYALTNHEMAHSLFTEKDLELINRKCSSEGCVFGTFNQFEDARVENEWRLLTGEPFNWADLEELIYDKDPNKFKDAKHIKEMTHKELMDLLGKEVKAMQNVVIDLVAMETLARANIEAHFVDGKDFDDVKNAILGKPHKGTIVKG